MSDEPKKRSRGWIGWALLAMFVLYPLSFGALVRFREYNPLSLKTTCAIYAPLDWAADHCEPFERGLEWYARLCEPP
jgi:hypothetical protein